MTIATALIGNTTANIYASTGNSAITWLSINSYGSGNVTANVYVVPSGGSAGAQNQILTNLLITEGDTYQLYAGGEKLLLSNNDTIKAVANTSSILNAVVSYTSI
jgi:hypothetical protein